jgi:hypothetical protein
MRKDGWYSGDSSGPSFIIETVSKAGGYAAPFMITPTNNVILNGGMGASGLSYGWVGIGTTAPANLLHVSGASSVGVIRVSSSGGGVMNFYDTAASANQKLYQWRSEGGVFRMALVNDAENAFVQQNILVANSSGNVGLGTASPNERLHVNGGMVVTGAASEQTGVNGLFLGFSGTAASIDSVQQGTDFRALSMSAKSLSFNTWNGSALVLGLYQSNAGNVGVGTATPGYKLDVAGQVRSSSGGFVFPDGSTQTKASVGTITGVTAGTGLTGGGTAGSLTLTNSDPGSSQNIFKNVANAAGAAQFSAGSNNDAIRFEGTGGTSVSFDAATKKVTINSSSSASSGWTDGGSSVSLTNAAAKVGVGTASPGYSLDVVSGGQWAARFKKTDATNGGILVDSASGYNPNVALSVNGVYKWYMNSNVSNGDSLQFWEATGTNPRFTLTQGGSVGIGTASPYTGSKLQVRTGTDDNLGVLDTTGGVTINAYNDAVNANRLLAFNASNYAFGVGGTNKVVIDASGNVGVGTPPPATPAAKLDVNAGSNTAAAINATGTINATGAITGATVNATYQDVAEWVPSSQKLPAGTVVVLDTTRTNHVLASTREYDTRVAGVVSDNPGVILGQGGEGKLKVATTGRVGVKVDATRAPIQVGDLLVTSGVEGMAMKSEPVVIGGRKMHAPGTIIGKALEPLEKGTGEILVLLSLQ